MNKYNKNNLRVSDVIFVEQAWEDERGHYHDEYAKIINIKKDGLLELSWLRVKPEIGTFLNDAEYFANDYEAQLLL